MGNRYELALRCAYCNKDNDVWYAPTCNSDTFKCDSCNKWNFITPNFKGKKAEDVTMIEVRDGFLNNTSSVWDEDDLKLIIREGYDRIINANEKA